MNLRAKGIWLVDASIVAVYGNGVKVSIRSRTEVLRESWESYTESARRTGPDARSCPRVQIPLQHNPPRWSGGRVNG